MIHTECIPPNVPEQVRIVGSVAELQLLEDSLRVMHYGSIAAEVGGTPFAYSPTETGAAISDWQLSRARERAEVRRISPRTAAIACRGLVRAHALLESDRAASGARDNDSLTERRHAMSRAIDNLTGLWNDLAEADFLPISPVNRESIRPDAE